MSQKRRALREEPWKPRRRGNQEEEEGEEGKTAEAVGARGEEESIGEEGEHSMNMKETSCSEAIWFGF